MAIEWLTSIAPFCAGFLTAVFAEPFRKWLTRPRLKVFFTPEFGRGIGSISLTPDKEDSSEQAYYTRASVQNLSRYVARSCRAYLVLIEYGSAPNKYRIIHQDPIPLDWSFLGSTQLDIPSKIKFNFDVFYISDATNRMIPRTKPLVKIWATTLADIGWYRYTVSVAGENINPVSKSIEFYWTGTFDKITPDRFGNGYPSRKWCYNTP
ncbi:MAG: hypothetical protein AAGG51_14980 [Cyanobacteria bacterium P01_G01_bin.54]